jgi:hypothetical protein
MITTEEFNPKQSKELILSIYKRIKEQRSPPDKGQPAPSSDPSIEPKPQPLDPEQPAPAPAPTPPTPTPTLNGSASWLNGL